MDEQVVCRCSKCKYRFRVLADEYGDHNCPKCGFTPKPKKRPEKMMMFKEIRSGNVQALGKNGYMNCKGIELDYIDEMPDAIRIYPITSKLKAGRSFIEIPIDEVEDFSQLILDYLNHLFEEEFKC